MTDIRSSKVYTTAGSEDLGTFKSYFYQVKYITELKPANILEIGIGNKTLNNYLRKHELPVTTCDYEETLNPDVVADVRELPFKDNEFDVVCAFQILEHIPWEDFPIALSELRRVSNKNVIFSVPYTPVSIEMVIKSSILKRLFNTWTFELFINLAFITRKWKYDGVHYWEMGKKNYSREKVRNMVKQYFTIVEEKRVDLSYQYFFVLDKK
jgi:SAM-dependent methyltransferase